MLNSKKQLSIIFIKINFINVDILLPMPLPPELRAFKLAHYICLKIKTKFDCYIVLLADRNVR